MLYLDNVKFKYCDSGKLPWGSRKATLPWGLAFNLSNNVWQCPEISCRHFSDKWNGVILAGKIFSLKRNREQGRGTIKIKIPATTRVAELNFLGVFACFGVCFSSLLCIRTFLYCILKIFSTVVRLKWRMGTRLLKLLLHKSFNCFMEFQVMCIPKNSADTMSSA